MKKSILCAVVILVIGAGLGGVYFFWDKLPLSALLSGKEVSLVLEESSTSESAKEQAKKEPFVESVFIVKTLSGTVAAVDTSSSSLTISDGGRTMTVVLVADTVIFDIASTPVLDVEEEVEGVPLGPETIQLIDIKVGNNVRISLQGESFDDLRVVSVDVIR